MRTPSLTVMASFKACRLRSIGVFFILLLCISFSAPAAGVGSIGGQVVDSATTKGIPGVTVRLSKTTLGKITNNNGEFRFRQVPAGQYQILVSLIGYETRTLTVQLKADDSVWLRIELREQVIRTSEVVVSANKRVQAVQDVPLSIAVVDAATISDRGATKLDEVLRYVPGVNVAQGQVNIRGTSGFAYGLGSRTLLMLDNFPMLSADNADMSFDALPMFSVDRIEVVKGPGSALYGTSAVGGVVNVLTKEPSADPEIRLRAFGSAYTQPRYAEWKWTDKLLHGQGVDASYGRLFGSTGIVLAGGMRSDNGYTQFSDSKRFNLYGKCTQVLSPFSQLLIFCQYAYEDRADWINWRSVVQATLPPENTDRSLRVYSGKFSAGAELKNQLSDNSFAILRASVFRTAYNNTASPDSTDYLASTATAYNSEGQYTTFLNPKVALTLGMTLSANSVSSGQSNGNNVQAIGAGYGQVEFSNINDIIVTAGARLDAEKTRGENSSVEFSPKLGIHYKAPTETNIRLSVGRSFRAPSIEERYADIQFAGFRVGHNPDLKPEHGWSFELGAEQTLSISGTVFNLDLSVYQSELYDLIEPQFDVSSTSAQIQFNNVTRARIQGMECDAKTWIICKVLGLESSLNLMQPTDLSTGTTLAFRHNVQWTNRLIYDIGNVELQCDYRYLSRQEQVDDRLVNLGLVADGDIRVPIHVVDLRVLLNTHIASVPCKWTVSCKNIFDYYYVEIPGNLAPIRSVSLQLECTL